MTTNGKRKTTGQLIEQKLWLAADKLRITRPPASKKEEIEQAVKQIVSEAITTTEVVDIFAATGIKKPDISILSDEFLFEIKNLKHKNLAIELLLGDKVLKEIARELLLTVNYELYEENLTGESYRKIAHGSAPCHFEEAEKELISENMIIKTVAEYHDYNQIKYIPLVKPDINIFSINEKEVIDKVIERLSSMNAKQIEDYSHKDIPYEITKDKEIINYETVFYRKDMHSVRE